LKEDLASILADLRREHVALLTGPPVNHVDQQKDRDELAKRVRLLQQSIHLQGTQKPGTGNRKWLEKWDDVDRLLPELVSLAGIRPTAYGGFCLAVHERMLDFIDQDFSMARDAAMLEAERRLRAAQDAIIALDERQRFWVSQAITQARVFHGHHDFRASFDDWTRVIPNMLAGIAMITGSAPYRPNEPTRRGPKRERSHLVLRNLIRDLWRIAREHDGDFTLSVNDDGQARGTIVKALRLLEPVLPPGLVPRVIPTTTFKRLRPDHNFKK
jgi:hypothetical protein